MQTTPLLDARGLSVRYGEETVLRDVSLTLAAGEVVSLLGPNGSGKSTLLRVLLGQLNGDGTVGWDGRTLAVWRRRELARLVAYLPQSPSHDPGQTVAGVLRLGRAPYWGAFGIESERDATVVREVAASLDLIELLDRPMDQLSGGQRQRVFVGRCLAQEPRALLLDEPGTFLDLRHHVELARLLRRLAQERGVSVLLASHDLNVAIPMSDRLLLLDKGSVAAAGEPERVLEPDLLARVYEVPMERLERGNGKPPAVLPSI